MRFLAVVLLLCLVSAPYAATIITSCNYNISASGDYVMNATRTCTGHGLTINASDVNVNLAGYSFDGDDGGSDYGIIINAGFNNIDVENGTIVDFGNAFRVLGGNSNVILRNVTLSSNGRALQYSIGAGLTYTDHLLTNLTVSNNTDTAFTMYSSGGTASGINITNSYFYNNSNGVHINAITPFSGIISGNIIDDAGGSDVLIKMTTAGASIVVSNNTLRNTTGNVIYISGSTAAVATGNIISTTKGFYVENQNDANISYNSLTGITGSAFNLTGSLRTGISWNNVTTAGRYVNLTNSNYSVIEFNKFDKASSWGAYLYNSHNTTFYWNNFTNVTGEAIATPETGDGITTTFLNITSNTFNNITENPIDIELVSHSAVVNNDFTGAGWASIQFEGLCVNNTISGNYIHGNAAGTDILVMTQSGGDPTNFTITNNTVTGNLCTGIRLTGTTNITTSYNNISNQVNATCSGFHIDGTTTGGVFINNTISNVANYIYYDTTSATNWYNTTIENDSAAMFPSLTLDSVANVSEGPRVFFYPNMAGIDISALPDFNASAVLTLYTDTTCGNITIGKLATFETDYTLVVAAGTEVGNASCSSGVAQYTTTGFSTYAIGNIFGGVFILPMDEGVLAGVPGIGYLLNVTFFDEVNSTQINATSAVLVFETGGRAFTISYSGQLKNATVKVYPSTGMAAIDSVEVYSSTSYVPRSRFMVNANTNLSVQQNISIYMLPSSASEYALIHVVDKGEPVPGSYVSIMKFFTSDATYTLMDQKITNGDGMAATYIDPVAYYKFAITDDTGAQLYYSTGPEQFICDGTCEITINIADLIPIHVVSPYANATCYGVNASNSIAYDYSDPSGLTSTINFIAYRENQTAPVCNYTVTAASAGYVCALPPGENLTAYLYSCEVWRTASPPILNYVNLIDFRGFVGVQDWLIPAVTLVVVLAVATASLAIGVALGGISLFALSALGLMNISVATSSIIMVAGFLLAFLLSKRGSDYG